MPPTRGREVPPDVPEGVLLELGRVVACGAWLENWLAVLAAALEGRRLGTGDSLFSGWAHRPARQVIDHIDAHAHLADDTESRILNLVASVRPMFEDRNKLVHGQWGAGETLKAGGVIKFDKTGDVYFGYFDTQELRDLAEQLNDAAGEASELALAVRLPLEDK
jgi:hypothetical protein